MQQNDGVIKMSICCSYLVLKNLVFFFLKELTIDIGPTPGAAMQAFTVDFYIISCNISGVW